MNPFKVILDLFMVFTLLWIKGNCTRIGMGITFPDNINDNKKLYIKDSKLWNGKDYGRIYCQIDYYNQNTVNCLLNNYRYKNKTFKDYLIVIPIHWTSGFYKRISYHFSLPRITKLELKDKHGKNTEELFKTGLFKSIKNRKKITPSTGEHCFKVYLEPMNGVNPEGYEGCYDIVEIYDF